VSKIIFALLLFLLCSCAGFSRNCSSWCADRVGADWLVVQWTASGNTVRCWELHGVSIANEENSDGIYWESVDGHLVHISGHYNRVQVKNKGWKKAYEELGIPNALCSGQAWSTNQVELKSNE